MAQIGDLEYPELTFSEALGVVEAIKTQKIQTTEGLAKLLGHTNQKSGTFFVKMAALNKYYGLVDQNKAEVALTPLAKAILFGMDNEKQEARRSALFRIPLIKALHEKLGADYNRDEFRPVLKTITNAAPEDLANRAPRVEKIYQDAVRHLPQGSESRHSAHPGGAANGTPGPAPFGSVQEPAAPPTPPPGARAADYIEFKDGATFLRIPKHDVAQLEQIKSMVDLWLEAAKRAAKKAPAAIVEPPAQ